MSSDGPPPFKTKSSDATRGRDPRAHRRKNRSLPAFRFFLFLVSTRTHARAFARPNAVLTNVVPDIVGRRPLRVGLKKRRKERRERVRYHKARNDEAAGKKPGNVRAPKGKRRTRPMALCRNAFFERRPTSSTITARPIFACFRADLRPDAGDAIGKNGTLTADDTRTPRDRPSTRRRTRRGRRRRAPPRTRTTDCTARSRECGRGIAR